MYVTSINHTFKPPKFIYTVMFCYFGWVTKVPDPICKRMTKFIKIDCIRGKRNMWLNKKPLEALLFMFFFNAIPIFYYILKSIWHQYIFYDFFFVLFYDNINLKGHHCFYYICCLLITVMNFYFILLLLLKLKWNMVNLIGKTNLIYWQGKRK